MQLGADPHQLEVLARSMRSAARQLQSVAVAHDGRLRSLDWHGPGVAARLGQLRGGVVAPLRHTVDGLADAARRLDQHAAAQRVASLADPVRTTLRVDTSGDGRLIEAVGVASAPVVVVLVPGVGTDLGDRRRLQRDAGAVWRAVALDRERFADGPRGGAGASEVAVVTWLGYDPPDHVIGGIDPGPAEVGARLLAADVAMLRAGGAERIVVVGHSYGAVVAMRAGAAGLDADEVVLLGAPGLGVDGIDRVALRPGGSIWAAAAEGDLVAWLARAGVVHGPDPIGIARRLPTSRRGHGAYLEDPVLLAALAEVVGGTRAISPGSPRASTVGT